MKEQGLGVAILLCVIVASSTLIPAYAEVTSLKTNTSFYKGGSKIYFSGTILDTDPSSVTLILFDPTGKFISLVSGNADTSHNFQIVVDMSASDNQQKFSLKGTYNATAFIATKENGKTVDFVVSPDGSPVLSSPPVSLTASAASSTEIDLQWVSPVNTGGAQLFGYRVERDDGSGFNQIKNVTSASYQDTGLTPDKLYSYRISAVNSAGTSSPSNVAAAVTLVAPTSVPPSSSVNNSPDTSLDELLKKRLADAKRLQDLLNGNNNPGSTSKVQTIQLNEKIALSDVVSDELQKSIHTQGDGFPTVSSNFDVSAVIYPIISLVGVGIVVFILYMRKKQNTSSSKNTKKEAEVSDVPSDKDGDHVMAILKNRLAKGEITVDEFKALKDELSEL